MSREFGSYGGGYFHSKMNDAADDLASGRDDMTKLWGKFFDAFRDVAYAIASSEACDSSEDHTIVETIQHLPAMKAALTAIEHHVRVYDDVAKDAVRKALEAKQKNR